VVWSRTLSHLERVLSTLFPSVDDMLRIMDISQVPQSFVAIQNSPINAWHNILVEANKRGLVSSVIESALSDYPENPGLLLAKKGVWNKHETPGIDLALDWRGPIEAKQLEKIIGRESSLVPISFLEKGLERQKSVARIEDIDGYGSGFLVDGNILVTNNHVIASIESARRCKVLFNYQIRADGGEEQTEVFRLEPGRYFATSEEMDLTAVRVEGNPNERWGAILIENQSCKEGDRVNIIQHPGGGHKQMSFYHNTVVHVERDRLQYVTDTMPGSSGSPVFDREWQLVAVHHASSSKGLSGTNSCVTFNEGISVDLLNQLLADQFTCSGE